MALPVKIASAWRFQCSVFRFQCFCFSSLTPDTRHLKPQDLVPEIRRLKMFHYSITPPDFRMKERRQKPPLGAAESRVLRARIF